MKIEQFLSLGLRGGGLIGKFVLMFFLARVITPEKLGVYGVIVVTLSYASYFLGLDFYTFAGRSMAQAKHINIPRMLRDQLVLYACSYMVVLPLISVLFLFEIVPMKFVAIFYSLLILEHLSQECVRLLIILEHPFVASILLFIRVGSWCFILVFIYMIGLIKIDLLTVFYFWVLGDIIALVFGGWWLRDLLFCRLTSEINWLWIISGLRISAYFIIGTLALRGLFTFDRYLVGFFSGKELLGVYSLYIGITGTLVTFIDAAIFSYRYPRLIRIYKSESTTDFDKYRKDIAKQVIISVILLGGGVGILVIPVLDWIGKPLYLDNLLVFYTLLVSSIVYVIGYIPHLTLYAMGENRIIVRSHTVGLALFLALGAFFGDLYGFKGIAFALLLAFIFISAFKQYYVIIKLQIKSG